ncbi:envelope stress response membrane protein PspC [Salinimonas chungwhensis]|uniref:envelope stress response membrane protein PspC n=1 Tax=Salinimonas chungwhensis TaxID=265425 RepID=UPI00037B68FA|nr:envelope stress response membrane protein PspC [Salinimonas chungwhensis]
MRVNRHLYRDTEHAQIAGVCAGIANYFGLERWLVRILVVTAFFLLAGSFIFVGYIICWFILEKKPADTLYTQGTADTTHQSSGKGWHNHAANKDIDERFEVKSKVWQAGVSPRRAVSNISQRFDETEKRLRSMEKYVTSREYQLNREINRL